MDDKDKKLRGKLEGLFSDLPPQVSAQAAEPVPPSIAVQPPSSAGLDGEALRAELLEVKQALSESQAHFREWFDEAPFGYHELDKQGCIVQVNRTEAEMLGYAVEEMLGRPAWEFIQESEVSRQAITAKLAGQLPQQPAERTFVRKDGSLVNVLIQDRCLLDADGKIRGIRATVQDITDRKQVEVALTHERSLLRALIDNLPDVIYVKDSESRFLVANMAEARLLGAATPEELLGKSDADYFPAELASKYRADEQAILQSGQPLLNYEERTIDPAGNPKWLINSKVLVRDSQGEVIGLVGMGRDITERKQVEIERERLLSEVRQSEQLMRSIIDATPDWIFIKDREHRYRLANQGYANALHLRPEDFVGKNDLELGFPEELVKGNPDKGIRGFWADDQLVMDTGETQVYPNDPATIDGVVHVFHTIKTPLRDASGQVWGVLAFARDVTDREQLVQDIQARAQRDQLINTMIARVRASLMVEQVLAATVQEIGAGLGAARVAVRLKPAYSDGLQTMARE
jgi:PAS domain S-box-containing protein